MSRNNSPTKLRRKEVIKRATDLVYKLKGAEYRDNLNPYPLNSFDFERFKRLYEKNCYFYRYMEGAFEDLAQVYGEFRPDKLKEIELAENG